jgi:hypothetical protein
MASQFGRGRAPDSLGIMLDDLGDLPVPCMIQAGGFLEIDEATLSSTTPIWPPFTQP